MTSKPREDATVTLPLNYSPASLDELRAWAREWNHLDDLATQVYRLFEEWDAANRLLEAVEEAKR